MIMVFIYYDTNKIYKGKDLLMRRNDIIALALLLITNILMGVTLMVMSKKTLRQQIDQRMLDIANTAAHQLDGDELKKLTKDDKGTESYNRQLNILKSFQDNIQLAYIYGIKDEGNNVFTFTIDPADDPGEFGELIKTTDALINSSKGTPSVDKKAYSDKWGRFYSAYSPVYDSEGEIVGIVGVDFDAQWYEKKINSHRAVAVILTMIAFSVGIVLAAIIMSQNRKSFSKILSDIDSLGADIQRLDNMILESSIKKLDMMPESENYLLKTLASGENTNFVEQNEYSKMSSSINYIHENLIKYLDFISKDVYIDDATRVKNNGAYKIRIKELDDKIQNGTAKFSVAFFDINQLKKIYTNLGYSAGDELMFECAKILKDVFGEDDIYHITGDEFIVLKEDKSRLDIIEYFEKFDAKILEYNASQPEIKRLSVAKGYITYDPEKHENYRKVFVQAKENCDRDKAEYYRKKENS